MKPLIPAKTGPGLLLAALSFLTHALASAAPAVQHVVHMTLDGLGGTYLQSYVTNAPAQFPNFVRLVNEGAFTFNARCDYDISETVPNHACVFTGRPVLQSSGLTNTTHHGYNNNFPGSGDTFHLSGNAAVPYKASFFDVAHDYGLSTAMYASKTRLDICNRSYNETHGAPDLVGVDNGKDKIDWTQIVDLNGMGVSNEVNEVILNLNSASPTNYIFVHLSEPDLTGHALGWNSVSWSNSVRFVDQQLGRILQMIESNPVLSNNTALVITADHGGGGGSATSHTLATHILNYTIPLFIWGPTIPAGSDAYALFSNRTNPRIGRPSYAALPQPLRNGDTGNIALALLGLPPIPGSFMVPVFEASAIALQIAKGAGAYTIWWADDSAAFLLEWTDDLNATAQWQTVMEGITDNGGMRLYSVPNGVESARFFRLRRP